MPRDHGTSSLDSQITSAVDVAIMRFQAQEAQDISAAVANLASTSYINSAINSALQAYVTITSLASILGGYVTQAALNTALGMYVTMSALSTALGPYARSVDVATSISTATSPLSSSISTLQTGLGTANSNIATNSSNISSLQTGLGTANTNITNLQSSTSAFQTSTTSALGTLNTTVGTNTSNISTLQTSVGTLQTGLSTANTNITSNTSNITALQSTVGTNTTNITSLQSGLTIANGNIATNTTNITSLQSGLTTANSNIATNTSSITSIQGILPTLATTSSLNTAITNLSTAVTSWLTGYLQLTGGTLTGLLTGTTAVFTSITLGVSSFVTNTSVGTVNALMGTSVFTKGLTFQNVSGGSNAYVNLKTTTPSGPSYTVTLPDSGGDVSLQYIGAAVNAGSNPITGGAGTFSGLVSANNGVSTTTVTVSTSVSTPALTLNGTSLSSTLTGLQTGINSNTTGLATLNSNASVIGSVLNSIASALNSTTSNVNVGSLTAASSLAVAGVNVGTSLASLQTSTSNNTTAINTLNGTSAGSVSNSITSALTNGTTTVNVGPTTVTTLSSGNMTMANGGLYNNGSTDLNVYPNAGGGIGFTNSARTRYGLKVTDTVSTIPITTTTQNTLDTGDGSMVVASLQVNSSNRAIANILTASNVDSAADPASNCNKLVDQSNAAYQPTQNYYNGTWPGQATSAYANRLKISLANIQTCTGFTAFYQGNTTNTPTKMFVYSDSGFTNLIATLTMGSTTAGQQQAGFSMNAPVTTQNLYVLIPSPFLIQANAGYVTEFYVYCNTAFVCYPPATFKSIVQTANSIVDDGNGNCRFNSTSTSNNYQVGQFLAANMAIGNSVGIQIGVSAANTSGHLYDSALVSFQNTGGDNSTTNTATLSVYGAPGISVDGTGKIYSTASGTGAVRNVFDDGTGITIYNSSTVNPPAFSTTTRSTGTRVVLSSALSASAVDYALGVDSGVSWTSVPTTSGLFRWYGGTNIAMSLDGTGQLIVGAKIIASTDLSVQNNLIIKTGGIQKLDGTTFTLPSTAGQLAVTSQVSPMNFASFKIAVSAAGSAFLLQTSTASSGSTITANAGQTAINLPIGTYEVNQSYENIVLDASNGTAPQAIVAASTTGTVSLTGALTSRSYYNSSLAQKNASWTSTCIVSVTAAATLALQFSTVSTTTSASVAAMLYVKQLM